MGQIGLGTMFITGTVANVDFSGNTNKNTMNQTSSNSFGKELDKVKNTPSNSKENRKESKEVAKPNENQDNQVTQKPKDEAGKQIKKEVTKVEETNDDTECKQNKAEINEEILSLLSQVLNVTPEELNELLMKMEYTATDLLNQEIFGEFIGEVYTQIKGENLLFAEEGLTNINKLFGELQSIGKQLEPENSELIPIQLQNKENVIGGASTQGQETHIRSDNVEEIATLHQTIKQPQVYTTVQTTNQKVVSVNSVDEKQTQVVMENTLGKNGKSDLGIVVPIQNFSSTAYTQLWPGEEVNIRANAQGTHSLETNILDQIDFKTLGTAKEINIQLSPKELGELSVKLVEENSSIVAQIKVDNEKTKALLISEMNILKSALEESGLTVADVRVDIKQDAHQSQMEQQKQKSSRRIQEIIAKHMQELAEEEEIVPEKISDSEIDYMV